MKKASTRKIERYAPNPDKELSPRQRDELLEILKARFEKNMSRHPGLEWADVQARLGVNSAKVWSLNEMERTGGGPDVIGRDDTTGEYLFCDCSAESPDGRRSICYYPKGLEYFGLIGILMAISRKSRNTEKPWVRFLS